MRIGFDFDNTIIDYDHIFKYVAVKKKLIPLSVPSNKISVRNYLKKINKENEWTILQGEVYGKHINKAKTYENCVETLKALSSNKIEKYIISHKTKYPFMGEKINLHESALKWLKINKFLASKDTIFKKNDIYFEETIEKKIDRILQKSCDVFIDDLPEILDLLPEKIIKVLFSPSNQVKNNKNYFIISNWSELSEIIAYL